MGGLIATQGHGDAWAWAAAGVRIEIHGFDAAEVSVDVHGL